MKRAAAGIALGIVAILFLVSLPSEELGALRGAGALPSQSGLQIEAGPPPEGASPKAAEDSPQDGATGIVVDPEGHPVADAVVRHWRERTRTDERGRFTLAFRDSMTDEIHAFHPDVGVGESLEPIGATPRSPVRVILFPQSRIRGRVVTAGGEPIQKGIFGYGFFRNRRRWSDSVRVPEDGRVTSDPLFTRMRRRVVVRFDSESHATAFRVVFVEPGRDADFGTLVVSPRPFGWISGRVERRPDEVNVLFWVGLTRIQSDDTFEVRVTPGLVRLCMLKLRWPEGVVAIGPTVRVQPGRHVRDYVIRRVPPGDLSIRVVDHKDRPVAGIAVLATTVLDPLGRLRLGRWGGTGVTNQHGHVQLEGLVAGRYFVAALEEEMKDDWTFDAEEWMKPAEVDVGSGANAFVLRLPSTDVVYGRVVDEEQRRLREVHAELWRTDGVRTPVKIEPDGRFTFPRPRGAGHRLVVRAPERAPLWRGVPPRSRKRHVYWRALELRRGRWIEGTVLTAEEEPARGANVVLVGSPDFDGATLRTRTDGDGRFAFPHAPLGEAVLRVEHEGATHEEELARRDPKDLRVRLQPAEPR